MDTSTKRLVIGGGIAAGAMLTAAGLVIAAGMAKADTAQDSAYISALRSQGIDPSPAWATLDKGRMLCDELQHMPANQLIYETTIMAQWPHIYVECLVTDAGRYLCPDAPGAQTEQANVPAPVPPRGTLVGIAR